MHRYGFNALPLSSKPTFALAMLMRMQAVAMAMAVLAIWVALFGAGIASGVSLGDGDAGGTIGFSTLGRLSFAFDVYTVVFSQMGVLRGGGGGVGDFQETRVTLGESVNYNAQLVESTWGSAVVERLRRNGHKLEGSGSDVPELLLYVSEVEGSPQLYLDVPLTGSEEDRLPTRSSRRIELLADRLNAPSKAFLNDRPSMIGDVFIFVSTEEDVGKPVQGWNAVYSLNFITSVVKRLTPPGITDYSPAVSPSGEWVAVGSNEGRGWQREIEALNLDLYIFKAEDGSQRRMIVRNGGWPTWMDDNTVYFHRIADDGWWSIFKVNVSDTSADQVAERVTPSGVHAFTPAASRSGKWIAVATRRASFRHIEIFELESKKFFPLTALINPNTHHYNPFVSPSSNKIGYHRCRGLDQDAQTVDPQIEYQKSPLPGVSLARIKGSFPSISPDGSLVSFVDSGNDSSTLAVMKLDGSENRVIHRSNVFGERWDPKGKTIYASQGRVFASVKTVVRIVAIQDSDTADLGADETSHNYKYLTKEGTGNNAFPCPSPDGKYVVFRSGRTGRKNLYIMDAAGGEEKYLRRLTEGRWRDTMPAWSPDNEWIAFSSNRAHPTGERSFSLYLIRPNGTDLHMLLDTGVGGLAMHAVFSPDSKRIAFTSNWAGVSAEPISFPHAYQPYGTIFVINIDGTGLTRLTHNAYEDGTPTWGRLPLPKPAISSDGRRSSCDFDDVSFLSPPGLQTKKPRGQCPYSLGTYVNAAAHVTSGYL
uniref:Dipeptidylpeptidase IV N-terminal domain-containing protein n=3 Tax=Physcomitrium patens TaxID=3218 RepID=A0A2K1L6G0_PHYPA|nr:uncharacterized protein LOC112286315 [Physcomitrium patens]PNR61619.1 hypothetical protein PHYPA_000042 [Physcomitrium patens]|eukprot:XP_024383837.1 uncharacterized protein LOC112286315 [Physcomitrella patens]